MRVSCIDCGADLTAGVFTSGFNMSVPSCGCTAYRPRLLTDAERQSRESQGTDETAKTEPSITKADLLAQLAELAKTSPGEDEHIDADWLLIRYINDPEIAAAYYAVDKWYA